MPNIRLTIMPSSMGRSKRSHPAHGIQWVGFLAALLAFMVVLTKSWGFHQNDLYLMLKPTSDGWGY